MAKIIKLAETQEGTLEWARRRAVSQSSLLNVPHFVFRYEMKGKASDFHTFLPMSMKEEWCDDEHIFIEEVKPDPEVRKRIEQELNGEIPREEMEYVSIID